MATISKKGILSGVIGPVIFMDVKGKNVAKSRAASVRQTRETKKCSTEFGTAVSASVLLRQGLGNYLAGLGDYEMHGRFTGAVFHAMRNSFVPGTGTQQVGKRNFDDVELQHLEGFEFNQFSLFSKYCSVSPELDFTDGILTVSVPAIEPELQIKHVRNAISTEVVFGVVTFGTQHGTPVRSSEQQLRYAVSAPAEARQLQTEPIPDGHAVFVIAALLYYRRGGIGGPMLMNNRDFHPCRLIAAFRA